MERGEDTADGWEQLRMARRLDAMIQTDFGLTEALIIWIDRLHVHVLSPERLPMNRGLRARMDLGPLGENVDLQLSVMEIAPARTSQLGRGWLHQARWIALSLDAGDRLMGVLPRLNPKLAMSSLVSSITSSRASMVSQARSGTRRADSGSRSHSTVSQVSSTSQTQSQSRHRSRSGKRRETTRSESTSAHRSKRGSVPGVVATGTPPNVLIDAVKSQEALIRGLRLGPGRLRVAVKLDHAIDATTEMILVFKLPNGSFLQIRSSVLRVAGRRWLLEATISDSDLAILRREIMLKK
jgi:hypothetical protein